LQNGYQFDFDTTNNLVEGDTAYMRLYIKDSLNNDILEPGVYTNVNATYSLFAFGYNYLIPENLPGKINVIVHDDYEFITYVENVFVNSGVVSVSTKITHGEINVNDRVVLESDGTIATVSKIEKFRAPVDFAIKGDAVLLTLDGVDSTQVTTGDALTFPRSSYPKVTTFKAQLKLLSAEEGGRTNPIRTGYVGTLFFGSGQEQFRLDEILDPVTNAPLDVINPGETANVTLTFVNGPRIMVDDLTYKILESGKVVGNLLSVNLK
jgi:elongation factor Tu